MNQRQIQLMAEGARKQCERRNRIKTNLTQKVEWREEDGREGVQGRPTPRWLGGGALATQGQKRADAQTECLSLNKV